ncbi:hypothetical protein [Actinoplanes sp. GCM10030250]|uniref:hypothetical protein n=1 Tax=Actinoplanes sp. GCM10030250 TaxID=3273376 RepID=UPI003608EEB0
MPSEEFFTTSAQVLPTLLIGFVVEVSLFLNAFRAAIRQEIGDARERPGGEISQAWQAEVRRTRSALVVFGGAVAISEALALTALWSSDDQGFAMFAAASCFTVIVAGILAIVLFPLGKLTIETMS